MIRILWARAVWVPTLLVFIAGCSKFEAKPGIAINESFFSAGDSSLIPASDKLTSDCSANPEFDTCIFLKNPVAQNQSSVALSELESQRRFGVKIRGLSVGTRLENPWVKIVTLHSPAFSLLNSYHLRAPIADETSYAEQLMAYYWANRAIEYMGARVGPARLPLRQLKIYVDDVFTGYSASNHSVHLEKRSGKLSRAFNGEVVLQLMGQALARELSGAKLFDRSNSTQHKYCRLDPRGCCSTNLGCAGALGSAFGDYFAATVFPGKPRIGESLASDVNGSAVCGLSRDPASLHLQTKSAIFTACAGANGYVPALGSWYSSIWWTIRNLAEASEAGASKDIDAIFFDHAKLWTNASTFTEARAAALATAASYKGGKFRSLIESTFNSKGL